MIYQSSRRGRRGSRAEETEEAVYTYVLTVGGEVVVVHTDDLRIGTVENLGVSGSLSLYRYLQAANMALSR